LTPRELLRELWTWRVQIEETSERRHQENIRARLAAGALSGGWMQTRMTSWYQLLAELEQYVKTGTVPR
jgi:hypothetical protein